MQVWFKADNALRCVTNSRIRILKSSSKHSSRCQLVSIWKVMEQTISATPQSISPKTHAHGHTKLAPKLATSKLPIQIPLAQPALSSWRLISSETSVNNLMANPSSLMSRWLMLFWEEQNSTSTIWLCRTAQTIPGSMPRSLRKTEDALWSTTLSVTIAHIVSTWRETKILTQKH